MPDGSEAPRRSGPAADAKPLLLQHPVSPSRNAPAKPRLPAQRAADPPPGPRPAPGPVAAGARLRHRWAALAFTAVVALPTLAMAVYLFGWAEDRYASRLAFSVRSSEPVVSSGMLGALAQFGGPDTDASIVYDFLQSQEAVERVGESVNLDVIFNRKPGDWLFRLGDDAAIEDLTDHWNGAVDVAIDTGSGIVDVEVRAFQPDDAHAVARAVLDASAALVNRLSEEARRDAVGFSAVELRDAERRLTDVRRRLREFRDAEQEVDPGANAQAALSLVAGLEQELANARVSFDLLAGLDRSAPRVRALERRIESLEARIEAERKRLGRGGKAHRGDRPLADLVGDYEDLAAERTFAEQAHAIALAAHQQAIAEARQHQRFLAVHVEPTRPERSDYPDRPLIIASVFALSLALWWSGVLIAWNVRDRG